MFNFKQDSSLFLIEQNDKFLMEKSLGFYQCKGDSLFFYLKQEDRNRYFMKYIIKRTSKFSMTLNGFTSENKKSHTLYLQKYKRTKDNHYDYHYEKLK